jgi:hypothetical protein
MMPSLEYIMSEDLRSSLEDDIKEMTACMKIEAWKAAHVLAGSIIEAVLIDFLISEKYITQDEGLKLDFGKALSVCKDKKVISQKTSDLSSVVKEYRNIIHPGRIIRLKEIVTKDTATVALALVDIITNEISTRRLEKYGYTAEQIVQKIERDPSATTILPHILKDVNPKEIEKLLIKVIPETYMQYDEIVDEPIPPHFLSGLSSCYRQAFEQSSEDIKKKATEKFVSVLKESSQYTINIYEMKFFRSTDLKYLSTHNADMVKQHLFSRIKKEQSVDMFVPLTGIGRHIKQKEINELVDPVVRMYISPLLIKKKAAVSEFIIQEWNIMDKRLKKYVVHRLDIWIEHLIRNKNVEGSNLIKELKSILELPF